jgi:Protein of unknown function (DUF3025)
VQSARALHQAARRAIEARFFTDWSERAPYTAFHPRFSSALGGLSTWPAPEQYDDLARQVPQATNAGRIELPRFVAQDRQALERHGGYEQHVARLRAVPTRERSWHDFFNMTVWAHFPRLRWALNALHVSDALGPIDPRNGRAPQQNVAAQFDESGIIVASSAPELLAELRALRFKRVFWERRSELLATTRFWVVGHGMLESLLTPHCGLSAKALLLELPRAPATYDADDLRDQLDARVADQLDTWHAGAPLLDPLPLLGIPGYADNCAPDFYDDERYFRFQRRTPQRR